MNEMYVAKARKIFYIWYSTKHTWVQDMRTSTGFVAALVGILALSGVAGLPAALAHSGDVLSAFGTAQVDGTISSNEPYGCISGSQTVGQTVYNFRICETNDENNDYYALEINDATPNEADQVIVIFDNGHDGSVTLCSSGQMEDLIVSFVGTPSGTYNDQAYCFSGGGTLDTTGGGTNDVVARTSTGGLGRIFELSHPLSSGDSLDYSLNIGDTVGFCVLYGDYPSGVLIDFPSGCYTAAIDSGDASGFGDIAKRGAVSAPVGGELLAVDKVRIVMPWVILTMVFGVVATLLLNIRKRSNSHRPPHCGAQNSRPLDP